MTPKMSDLMIENVIRFLRNCLLQRCFPGPVKRSYIFSNFDKKKVSEIRTNFLAFPVHPHFSVIWYKHSGMMHSLGFTKDYP